MKKLNTLLVIYLVSLTSIFADTLECKGCSEETIECRLDPTRNGATTAKAKELGISKNKAENPSGKKLSDRTVSWIKDDTHSPKVPDQPNTPEGKKLTDRTVEWVKEGTHRRTDKPDAPNEPKS